MKYIVMALLALMVMSGCTNKELNENASKVGDGVKDIGRALGDAIEGKN